MTGNLAFVPKSLSVSPLAKNRRLAQNVNIYKAFGAHGLILRPSPLSGRQTGLGMDVRTDKCGFAHFVFPMATTCPCVRKKIVPSEMAGVAMQTSFIWLVANTVNSGVGLITKTSPCSPVK